MHSQFTEKLFGSLWTCRQIRKVSTIRLVILLCTLLQLVVGNAQVVDTARHLQKIDSLVASIDQNKNLKEFIDEGQAINKRTGKALNDGYATYFYHDETGKKLLKVYDNPVRKEPFAFYFYSCDDTLFLVKTVSRRKNKVNTYYVHDHAILRIAGPKPYLDFYRIFERWKHLVALHRQYCP